MSPKHKDSKETEVYVVVHTCSPRMWEEETRGSDQEFKIILSLYETLKGPEAWETRCPAEL